MTEAEWLAVTDPTPMLEFLRGKASDRKLRLLACACARDVEDHTLRECGLAVSELVERHADGRAQPSEIESAVGLAQDAAYGQTYWMGDAFGVIGAALLPNAAESATMAVTWLRAFYSYDGPEDPGQFRPTTLCRDIFGNPFRPVAVDPSWLTSTVLALAEGIYQDRAFDRMPYLADALQDSGCNHEDVLHHCRAAAEHHRGCWVIDLLTGRR